MFDKDNENTHISEINEGTIHPCSPVDILTKGEFEVLKLIAQGYRNSDIAKELYISEHTVNDYTKKIYRKLNVHNRHAAAQILLRYGNTNKTDE